MNNNKRCINCNKVLTEFYAYTLCRNCYYKQYMREYRQQKKKENFGTELNQIQDSLYQTDYLLLIKKIKEYTSTDELKRLVNQAGSILQSLGCSYDTIIKKLAHDTQLSSMTIIRLLEITAPEPIYPSDIPNSLIFELNILLQRVRNQLIRMSNTLEKYEIAEEQHKEQLKNMINICEQILDISKDIDNRTRIDKYQIILLYILSLFETNRQLAKLFHISAKYVSILLHSNILKNLSFEIDYHGTKIDIIPYLIEALKTRYNIND